MCGGQARPPFGIAAPDETNNLCSHIMRNYDDLSPASRLHLLMLRRRYRLAAVPDAVIHAGTRPGHDSETTGFHSRMMKRKKVNSGFLHGAGPARRIRRLELQMSATRSGNEGIREGWNDALVRSPGQAKSLSSAGYGLPEQCALDAVESRLIRQGHTCRRADTEVSAG